MLRVGGPFYMFKVFPIFHFIFSAEVNKMVAKRA